MPYKVWNEKLSVKLQQWYKVYADSEMDAEKVLINSLLKYFRFSNHYLIGALFYQYIYIFGTSSNCTLRSLRIFVYYKTIKKSFSFIPRVWHTVIIQLKDWVYLPNTYRTYMAVSIRWGFPLSRLQITEPVLWNFAIVQVLALLNNSKDLDSSLRGI